MKRLAAGVYDDEYGGLHLDVPELLAAHGYADTPENRALLIAAASWSRLPVPRTDTPIVRPSFTCPRCGWVSHHPQDVTERYCGHCHVFLDDL
jgi:ribosomal protein S27AE